MNAIAGSFTSFVCVVALAVSASAAPAQNSEEQEARAQARITELFELRVDLLLEGLNRNGEFEADAKEIVRASLHTEVAAFMEANPVKLLSQGPISWNATPIQYEPFDALLESDSWHEALDRGLTASQREALIARIEEREVRVRATLEALIQAHLRRGLCLADSELLALAAVVRDVADQILKEDLVTGYDPYNWNNQVTNELFVLLEAAEFTQALGPDRRAIVERIPDEGHTELHDYLLEAEFALVGHVDDGTARRLLHGCAAAIVGRNGGSKNFSRNVLQPAKDLAKDDFWNKVLRRTLELDPEAELPVFPSRSDEELRSAWAAHLLAILDRRAFFSADQRESLLPLIQAYSDYQFERSRGRYAGGLRLPGDFGLDQEGMLIPGQNNRNQNDTKLKAMIKTFHEACTEAQREVMGA